MKMKKTSRLSVAALRVCIATLLLSHACRTVLRNSVWRHRRSLFTYDTVTDTVMRNNAEAVNLGDIRLKDLDSDT